MIRVAIFLLTSCFFSLNLEGQDYLSVSDNPIELGKVQWIRDYDDATLQSEKDNTPIFLLFQEVPGCSNCTKYGKDILSHPLIVEAIEDNFIPVAIYNNKGGKDKEVLRHFGEPAWNNPVVRLVNSNGANISDRVSDFRSTSELITAMIGALKYAKKKVPGYLINLKEEYMAIENGTDEIYLSMFCFWTGEKEIGKMEGVVSTEAGFMHGREVVKVGFNNTQTNAEKIIKKANKVNCGDQVFSDVKIKSNIPFKNIGKYSKDKKDKYFLLNSPYKNIVMTDYQKTLVNSALGFNKDPRQYLSPRQLKLVNKG